MENDTGFDSFIKFIETWDDITILSHISPDGDTLGSALAVYMLLKRFGKNCEVVCGNPTPKIYSFLPHAGSIVTPEQAKGYDAVIAIDCADKSRFGRAAGLFETAKASASIDHHITNPGFADVNLIVPGASAVAEIVYALYLKTDVPVDDAAAACIYTGIVTDTGNFSYSNTTPAALRITADFVERGLDITAINRLIYRTVPYSKTRVQGFVNSRIRLEHGGEIGIGILTREQMLRFGASDEDCEGIVDCVRDIAGVKIAAFIREGADGSFKVSLRSKTRGNVCNIAEKFNGGGHQKAAGFTAEKPLSTVVANIIGAAERELAD